MIKIILRNKLLYFGSVCLIFVVIVLGCRVAFYNGYIRLNYPSPKRFPVHGIDISHHQGHIRWKEIDKKKVQFVFAKATEGKDFVDPLFQENLKGATEHMIPIGGYHFFTFCRSGKEQADNYIANVPVDEVSLPPVIDLEFGGNCQQQISNKKLVEEIQIYIEQIEENYQKKVIIYATREFYQQYLLDNFLENPIWIRDIYKQPNLPKKRKPWLFWQYANRGRLKGIDTFVDFNVFFGDERVFYNLVGNK